MGKHLIVDCIRRDLKKYYPSTQFKIELEKCLSASSVVIYYNDEHPKAEEVYNKLNKYQMGDFDLLKGEYFYNNIRQDVPQVKYIIVEHP